MHAYHVESPYADDVARGQMYMPTGGVSSPACIPLCIEAEVSARQRDTVGNRIAQARRELGVRLGKDVLPATLAEMLGVNASTVTRWEANEKAPSGENLIRLAELLGVSATYIMRGGDATTAPRNGAPQIQERIHEDVQDNVRMPPKGTKRRPASG
jgi:transcriptional regulator with XRE-family HTH domain